MSLGEYYDSRKSVDFTKKKTSGSKTFADEFNDDFTLTDSDADDDSSEEEKKSDSSMKGLVTKRQRFKSVSQVSVPSIRKRRLSYSKTTEELFLATFPVH